jgi:hypothetical protein
VARTLPRNNNGSWDSRGNVISIATERQVAPGLRPGSSWSISHTRADEKAAVRATFIHELGHHVHLSEWTFQPSAVDLTVVKAYKALGLDATEAARIEAGLRESPAITQYAAKNSDEYFAESFAAYHLEPEALKAHDPGGFKMVEDVLRLKGILK